MCSVKTLDKHEGNPAKTILKLKLPSKPRQRCHSWSQQTVTDGADNLSGNYGGPNSVVQKLSAANPPIMKGSCTCQILNNTMKTATFCAGGYDVRKMLSEFSCYARKLEMLQDACKFTNMQYKETRSHVPTQWLTLLPAV